MIAKLKHSLYVLALLLITVFTAKDLLAAFDTAAAKAGVLHETFMEKCPTTDVPDLLVDYARLRDLTIVPLPESYDQWYAETVIFGSGRPTLILPETPRARPARVPWMGERVHENRQLSDSRRVDARHPSGTDAVPAIGDGHRQRFAAAVTVKSDAIRQIRRAKA